MPASELRGSVLEVVGALLANHDAAAVLEIVGKLVAENADMARRLARSRRASRARRSARRSSCCFSTRSAYRKLYKIEDEIRELDPEAKLAARRERSRPVFDSLANWCRVRKKYEPPATPLGKALQYFTNHEVALGRCLDDGRVPMDNGIVERLHIRAALTRKNFLFAGSDAGGERAAIAYTLFGSRRLAGVDPIAYLADVLPKLTRRVRLLDLPALLPSRWRGRCFDAGEAKLRIDG